MCAKTRAINLPGNTIGSTRQHLYKRAFEQIKKSLLQEFYLEAITIIESIIADLLERRISWLTQHSERAFSNLGPLKNRLSVLETDASLRDLFDQIDAWRRTRNEIHEVVKLEESALQKNWDTEYQKFKVVAEEGIKLARDLMKNIRRVNQVS